ncbi:hypothetical protein [Pseudobacteriovorax antillogorgiicola]|uniref:Uncharacterized protein n=1 Tax=Pseudobacteriovorax antillogorgiicola TaxID=1513793 RepID=A0A1Y6CN25_9BACT|nr:hypothetical protein [Pseudobacteriovorax antillogorgiicola]TCS44782.1 hypothetical protein EDD56_13111 [Pseudobacteriovorax antillogorgiicola]SMF77492.1 hypothetical protein SAMN06296036_13153 [Pseudobacteriovorax antillogorgiicola]
MKKNIACAALLLGLSQTGLALKKIKTSAEYTPVNRQISGNMHYAVEDYTIWLESDENVNITFTLPEMLLGKKNKVHFSLIDTKNSSKGKVRILKSKFGTLTCFGKWTEARCSVAFENLAFDFDRLYQIAQQHKGMNLVQIARHFSEEPLGVVVVKAKRKP